MPLISDIVELKKELGIPAGDTSQDARLNYWIEQATDVIETFLDRKGLFYGTRTEYYSGTGTQKLLLKSRPVYVTDALPIQLWEDRQGCWGQTDDPFPDSTELDYGDDFVLADIDADGLSQTGILFRRNDYWNRPFVRQPGYLTPFLGAGTGNIKVTYTAGYKIDTLPPAFRLALSILVAQLRTIVPYGWALTSESYEERSVSYQLPSKLDMLAGIKSIMLPYRNWHW